MSQYMKLTAEFTILALYKLVSMYVCFKSEIILKIGQHLAKLLACFVGTQCTYEEHWLRRRRKRRKITYNIYTVCADALPPACRCLQFEYNSNLLILVTVHVEKEPCAIYVRPSISVEYVVTFSSCRSGVTQRSYHTLRRRCDWKRNSIDAARREACVRQSHTRSPSHLQSNLSGAQLIPMLVRPWIYCSVIRWKVPKALLWIELYV